MRIPPTPHVRFALVGGFFILLAGCANPSSQSSLNSLSVKVTPAIVTVGGAVSLQATEHLSDGTAQDVTSGTQWTLSNASLATLGNGVLISKAPGNLTVQATYVVVAPAGQSSWTGAPQTLSSSAQVTITAPGTTATTPSITWSTPAAVQYGTALDAVSLDATANVTGSFVYAPAAGAVLKAGTQTLTATFTPSDVTAYTTATATVHLTVTPASPVLTWAPPSPIRRGTAISATQLNAMANVPGTFSYSPAAGTVVAVGIQPLTATFTPSDAIDYMQATMHNSLTVDAEDPGKNTPIITWRTPAPIQYGPALSNTQLDASASVPGSFSYTPAAGAALKAGTHTLTAVFTPTDTTTYSSATAMVQFTVNQATPVITWGPLSAIQEGTAIGPAQLDAVANVPGTFSYTPAAGTVVAVGTQPVKAAFTPSDKLDYTSATAQNSLTTHATGTGKSTPNITWRTPAAIQYGPALTNTQLDATASVPGSFAYTPPAGTVLKAGIHTLTAVFTPTDTTTYSSAAATVQSTVNQATPVITWAPLAAITQGTAIGPAQLNAVANVPGTFSYTPVAGTVVTASVQPLTVAFTPSDKSDYTSATARNSLTAHAVGKGKSTPVITWRTPAATHYGLALSSVELDATASVPGSFAYTPPAGTVLEAGTQALTATFTPTNATTYSSATAVVQLTVNQATPAITWAQLAAITQGTALSKTQLDAVANVPGGFVYSPAAGIVPAAGTLQLTTTFTPTDTTGYASVTAHNALVVKPSTQTPAPTTGPILKDAYLALPNNAYTNTLMIGASLAFYAVGDYSSGPTPATIPNAQVVWSSSHPAVLSVSSTGNAVAVAVGQANIQATIGAVNSSPWGVTVSAVPSTNPTKGTACPIQSGASQATIQSILNACGSGNTAVFAAGSYDINSTLNWPCGVSIAGPTPAGITIPSGSGSMTVYPGPYTATLDWIGGGGNWVVSYPSGCTASGVTFQFMNVNGNQPDGGGGGSLYLGNGGGTGPTIQFNYFHGVQSDTGGDCCASGLIFVDGTGTTQGHSVWNDLTINWNTFGATDDCSVLMNTFSYNGTNYNNYGGYCDAVDLHTSTTNLTMDYNKTVYLEQGFKFQEPGPNGGQTGNPSDNQYLQTNANVMYNDFAGIHRITIEAQDTPYPTENFDYNDWHDPVDPGYGSFTFSLPQYDGSGATYTSIFTNVSYNVFASNVPTGSGGGYIPGVEFWSNGQANYNLYQGNLACGIQFGYGNTPWEINYNTYQGSGSNICNEENQNTNPNPSQTGNTTSTTVEAVTSVTPTISPTAGSFSGSQVVTFTNPGTNRDANTGIWYTTDGSTPVPGAGTAQFILSGGTITITGATTIKAVGMWGQYNQPRSYPSGFGYVPSAVVSASFSPVTGSVVKQPGAKVSSAISGTNAITAEEPTADANGAASIAELTSVAVVPAQATVSIGSTTQLKAIATFSDGSTKDVTTNFAWASSDTRTITATSSGLLAGLASGKATITGSYQGHQATVPAVSTIGQVEWSAPIVITEAGTYSGNWRSTDSKSPAVTVATTAPVVIESSHISSVAGLIKTTVAGADVTVRNTVALALNPAVKGQSNGVFLDASSPARLDVENNYVENAGGGVLVHGYSGNRDGQQTIVIRANRARNLNGLLSDGNGGYLPGVGSNRSVSNFIQLDKVQSVPGIDVGWNEVINYPGRSLVADNIDVKRSSGTPNQPLEIHDTYIQGAYPYTAAQADYQGGGIKIEGSPDDSAQDATAFNNIHDNQVVGTVNYGIAFTAGHDNIASNNRVISSGRLADGTRIAAQYVGMANGDVNGASVANPSMYNNTMHDNLIGWACWNSSCSQSGYRKDQSFPASPADYSTNSILAAQPITPDMENNEYQIWLNKTASAGVSVGPAF